MHLMAAFPAAWCVGGGWAIDLFLGRWTRPHDDRELCVLREDQGRIHEHLPGWRFEKLRSGVREAWQPGERLELPVHEVHGAAPEGGAAVEWLLNERSGEDWVFRRDPSLRLPLTEAFVTTGASAPHLAPEIVLLFKAKAPREKDELDFASALPELSTERRRWLRESLQRCHPGHPWLARV